MTGYYEPLLTVSKHRTERHTTPILSTPDDLIIVDLAEAYPKLKGMRLRGKIQGRKLVPYDTRAKIVARKDLDMSPSPGATILSPSSSFKFRGPEDYGLKKAN